MRHERRLRCTVPGSPTLRVCRRAFLISPLIVCHTLLRVCHSHLLCTRTSQPLPGNLSPLRLLCTRTLLRLLLVCTRRFLYLASVHSGSSGSCSCALGGPLGSSTQKRGRRPGCSHKTSRSDAPVRSEAPRSSQHTKVPALHLPHPSSPAQLED